MRGSYRVSCSLWDGRSETAQSSRGSTFYRLADVVEDQTLMERWRFGDPAKVYERIEAQRRRRSATRQHKAKEGLKALFGDGMTEDQSAKLEEYLMIWYDYERAYRPHLGAPRVSSYYRGVPSTGGLSDRDEAEHRYEKMIAETISACMDELPWQQRSAISIHCEVKRTGASIVRNSHMTIEEHLAHYRAGKQAIFEMPRMRELLW